ncbi:MAG: hypothetical protein H0X45_02500 [Planctomycetes bacterium]|nr:hypothetical protein [Planctomycetota bacterium]
MRSGADAAAKTQPNPSAPASLTEEMFREAIELAHRVNRRITDPDPDLDAEAPKAVAAGSADR